MTALIEAGAIFRVADESETCVAALCFDGCIHGRVCAKAMASSAAFLRFPVGVVPLGTRYRHQSVFHNTTSGTGHGRLTFETDTPDFVSLDDLLPWGPQFATGYAFRPVDADQACMEPFRWAALHAKRREANVAAMVKRLAGLFEPEWSEDFERFKDMLWGNRFAVGWLPSSDVSAAIDAYVRINRAGIRVREEERALALLSRAWPQLLDALAEFIRQRDGGDAVRDQRALLVHSPTGNWASASG
jgi:hypothetical protein